MSKPGENYQNWSVEDVSNWLGEIHLSNHIPNFERHGITGARLGELTDKELRDQLRVIKPSELMALQGAIHTLKQGQVRKASAPSTGNSRTMSSLPTKRERTNSGGNSKQLSSPLDQRTKTMPQFSSHVIGTPNRIIERPVIKAPDMRGGSAPELLDDKCRYSGWIRKQGGGHKSWKRRYLILRAGCLYYFSNETASAPKGKFVLSGYQTSICRDADIVKKYPFVLKLSPMNPHVRTYYVSFSSKGELERWKRELDEEIDQYNQGSAFTERVVMPLGSPPLQLPYGEEEEEEGDDSERLYAKVDRGEPDYAKPDTAIYDDPADINGDDLYDRVEEMDSVDGRPAVLPRSRVSLQPPPGIANIGPGAENDIYLPIIGADTALPTVAEHSSSSPTHTTVTPTTDKPSGLDDDYMDPSDEEADPDSEPDSDDDGGYYIMFRKPDELMPHSCIFEQLDRAEADKLLREQSVDGTYLIREGTRAGAEKVLSVWHIDRCRHYKLFKDVDSYYSLTQGQRFRSLPELLQYYSLQSHLPRSDFYLVNPYTP